MNRIVLAAIAASLAATPALAADGEQLFNVQCKMCHGGSTMGPSLQGVVGGKIAARSDFNYSPALKAKGGVWNKDNLEAFLAAPSQFAPGTRMLISVQPEENRKAIIHYLKTLK